MKNVCRYRPDCGYAIQSENWQQGEKKGRKQVLLFCFQRWHPIHQCTFPVQHCISSSHLLYIQRGCNITEFLKRMQLSAATSPQLSLVPIAKAIQNRTKPFHSPQGKYAAGFKILYEKCMKITYWGKYC